MSFQISLAPFKGLTQKEYRRAYAKHFPGPDLIYAPFISGVHPEKVNMSKFDDLLPFEENAVETVPQFVSINGSEILAIARALSDHGYTHINWNMGCPFSRIADKMRGCGILPYPDTIKRLMDEIMPKMPLELSIKTRLGYYSGEELPVVIDIFNQYPLRELIIHARTGQQLYTGSTNQSGFQKCLQMSLIPVAYNGDIFHQQSFEELQLLFPNVKSWMVGRGALINPFLPAQIKGILMSEYEMRSRIQGFHNEVFVALSAKGIHEKKILGQMKAIWYYMSGVFSGGRQLFQQLKVSKDSKSYLTFADEMLKLSFATNNEIEHHWMHGLKHVGGSLVSQ